MRRDKRTPCLIEWAVIISPGVTVCEDLDLYGEVGYREVGVLSQVLTT